MSNYGNTLDRWYRRGAIALWPRARAFAVRAEASPAAALDELSRLLRRRDDAGAVELALSVAPFWDHVVARSDGRAATLDRALRVAAALGDPQVAAMLLRPFALTGLGTKHAASLVALVERHGEDWLVTLLGGWSARRPSFGGFASRDERTTWMASLPETCQALCTHGTAGKRATSALLGDATAWLRAALDQASKESRPSWREKALAQLVDPTVSVLAAAALSGAAGACESVAEVLSAQRDQATSFLVACVRSASSLPARRRPAAVRDKAGEPKASRDREGSPTMSDGTDGAAFDALVTSGPELARRAASPAALRQELSA